MSVRHQASDVNKQAVCGDAARHEVMIQMTEDIQLLRSNLFTHVNVKSALHWRVTDTNHNMARSDNQNVEAYRFDKK